MQLPSWLNLAKRSIAARLQWATMAAVAALVLLLGGVFVMESRSIEQDRVALLRAEVESARSIAAAYEAEARDGRLTTEQAQQAAARAIGAMRYLGAEYLWINDLDARMIMHPVKPELNGQDMAGFADPTGKHIFTLFASEVRAHGEGLVDYLWPRPGSDAPVPKLSFVQGFTPWGWVIGTGVYVDDIAATRWRIAALLGGLGGGFALLVGGVIWLLGRSVSRPTRALAEATRRLSAGDISVSVPGIARADELGVLARALDMLKQNEHERRRLAHITAEDNAARDRRQAAMDQLTQDFGAVISGVLSRLTRAAVHMSDTARELTEGTERTRRSALQTAEGSTSSSHDLATVASATVQFSASVDEIARQVAHAGAATREAVGRADESTATFERLSAMAERIGDVGAVISRIAAQTNLLALNATIEAARAGEAGKGFAVVANEVKALAGQTARATAEISENVAAIRGATGTTAAAIREVGSAIERVDAVSAAIAAAIEQQGATTRDISASVQHVASTGERIATAIAEVAGVAESSGTLSQAVLTAAGELGQVADTLRQEVDQFLRTMAQQDLQRRRYERVTGHDAPATLYVAGTELRAPLRDLSRGGAALGTTCRAEVGSEVRLAVPGARQPIHGRIVRHGDQLVAIAFRQDERNLLEIDAALDALVTPQSWAA